MTEFSSMGAMYFPNITDEMNSAVGKMTDKVFPGATLHAIHSHGRRYNGPVFLLKVGEEEIVNGIYKHKGPTNLGKEECRESWEAAWKAFIKALKIRVVTEEYRGKKDLLLGDSI